MYINKNKLNARMQQRKALEQFLEQRCAADAAFKSLLLEDPVRAIEEIADIRLPGEVTVRIVPEDPEELCLVLPFLPEEDSSVAGLSDEALSRVNGGALPQPDLIDLLATRLNGQLKFFPDN